MIANNINISWGSQDWHDVEHEPNMGIHAVSISPEAKVGATAMFLYSFCTYIICVVEPHKFLHDKCLTCIKPY